MSVSSVYICEYTNTYILSQTMYIYTYKYICCTYMYIIIFTYAFTYTCTYIYAFMRSVYTSINTYLYVYIFTYIHNYTVYAYVCVDYNTVCYFFPSLLNACPRCHSNENELLWRAHQRTQTSLPKVVPLAPPNEIKTPTSMLDRHSYTILNDSVTINCFALSHHLLQPGNRSKVMSVQIQLK